MSLGVSISHDFYTKAQVVVTRFQQRYVEIAPLGIGHTRSVFHPLRMLRQLGRVISNNCMNCVSKSLIVVERTALRSDLLICAGYTHG